MNLFIVESPAKAKTIKQYLGKNYNVIASMGHIRELVPTNGSIDTEHNFEMKYRIIERSKAQVKKIVELAKDAEKIYLASDPDREGEAIADALYSVLIEKKVAVPEQFYRITYTEITKKAIEYAVEHTRCIDRNLVDAQQSRSALDYLVGFNLSPVLWRKLPGAKSAGRVQSVALKMIIDREFEIKKFKPEEYWSIECNLLTSKKEKVDCRIIKYNDKNVDIDFPKDEKSAETICSFIKKTKQMKVIKNDTKDVKQNPYPPFTTALLQQDAVRKLGFSSKKTMTLAQKLYEGVQINGQTVALITYMRTDGMTLSNDALRDIRNLIKKDFGDEYLPEKALFYKTKAKNAQEAHEAIRPTHIEMEPSKIKADLETDMWKLYDLIWKRTVACQMKPAIYARQIVDLVAKDNENEILGRINGSQLKFNGYLSVYNIKNETYEVGDEDDNDKLIPLMNVGDVLDVYNVIKEQHFTNPPARYSEASLIKTLEKYGIGRPSTYATIISVLQDREYVSLQKKQFIPTSRGIVVAVFLEQFFEKYVEYGFTAKLEEDLDLISDGKVAKVSFLRNFWEDFNKNVQLVMNLNYETIFGPLNKIFGDFFLNGDLKCPKCGKEIGLKSSKFGVFWGCNNYPNCKYMLPLDGNGCGANGDDAITIEHKKYGKIVVKTGQYGRYCEFTDGDKIKKCSLPNIELTDDVLDFYLNLPFSLGKDDNGNDVKVGIGRFGAYILNNSVFYSCKFQPLHTIKLNDALDIIEQQKDKKMKSSTKRKTATANKSKGGKTAKTTKTVAKKSRKTTKK